MDFKVRHAILHADSYKYWKEEPSTKGSRRKGGLINAFEMHSGMRRGAEGHIQMHLPGSVGF